MEVLDHQSVSVSLLTSLRSMKIILLELFLIPLLHGVYESCMIGP